MSKTSLYRSTQKRRSVRSSNTATLISHINKEIKDHEKELKRTQASLQKSISCIQ